MITRLMLLESVLSIITSGVRSGLQRSATKAGLLLVWAVIAASGVRAAEPSRETGHPLLRNYTPREFHAFSSVHAAVQDPRGIMYFGTRACVLEYDGVSWRKVPVGRPTSTTMGMAIEPATGTIFVGGTDELGYLEGIPGGERRFVSLLEKLPADARSFKDIVRVFATGEGIVFVAGRQIMRWRDGAFRVWKLDCRRAARAECAAGCVYVQNKELGLLRLQGDSLVPASTDPTMHQVDIVMMVPREDGSFLVATYKGGLYTLTDGVFTPVASKESEFFKTKLIRAGGRLREGSLVIGTESAGIILLNEDLTFRHRWDEASGLQNETLWSLSEDREGGVWLCLDVGVTRVENTSVISVFDAANGLKNQNVYDAARLDGHLVLATATGLYRIVEADSAAMTAAHCERVPGADGFFIDLCAVEQGLLVGGTGGVSLLDAAWHLSPVHSPAPPALCMTRSRRHPERVFVGTTTGLDSLRRDDAGHWQFEGSVAGVDDQVRSIVEDEHGGLWLGTFNLGLLHLEFSSLPWDGKGAPAGKVTSYFDQPGPLSKQSWVMVAASESDGLIAVSKERMCRFDPATRVFVPADGYGARFADGSFQIEQFEPAAGGGVWLAGHASQERDPEQEAGWVSTGRDGPVVGFHALPAKLPDKIGKIETIAPEDDGVVWLGGADGLVRLDSRRWRHAPPPPPGVLIRQASTTLGTGQNVGPQPILQAPLPYARNSVHFDYAANTFAVGPPPQYQTRLVGFERDRWSDFSGRTNADYTNLPEGAYVFEVRAQGADGFPGNVSSLPFRILPPWQRTPWAYALYGVVGVIGIVLLFRWRGQHLRQRNAALETLVDTRTSELQGREADLRRARDDAEAANRAKSAFLANMSHELRTPLNAILGFSQILLKNVTLDPRGREQVTVIGESGNHLLSMINEVLDLAKIEAGKLVLILSDFSLHQLLNDVCAMFRSRFAEKGIDFQDARVLPPSVVVHADVGRLRQTLFNLLGNALKFTPRGTVELRVTALTDGQTRFEIIDTRIGIHEEHLEEIFLAFHQAGDVPLAAQGTGLGLAISQRLVGLMGGRIEVESTPGRGSRFWFDLSLPFSASAVLETGRDSRNITGYQSTVRRLLVVDDQQENRRVLRDLLQPLGFEIEEAADGEQCLALCEQHLPDAVLLDLRLGTLDGFEVARRLRQIVAGAPLGIIAVSASVFESDRQQAIDAGCDDFVPKPFKEDQLHAVLGRVLGLRWVFAPKPESSPVNDGSATDFHIAPDEVDKLIELSLRGDIVSIRKHLEALRKIGPHGEHSSLVRGLEPLVASFQMDGIHKLLLKYKERGSE